MQYQYDNRLYVTNTHPELDAWLDKTIAGVGGTTTNRISSAVDGVLQLRDNVIKKTPNTLARSYEIDRLRVMRGIPRMSLETAVADLLNLDFRTYWICNSEDCLEYRMSCQVLLPDDVGYSTNYETLVDDARRLGLYPEQQWSYGVKYIVLPMRTTNRNLQWLRKICYIIGKENNILVIREDKFHDFSVRMSRVNNGQNTGYGQSSGYPQASGRYAGVNKFDFPNEYVLLDTEHKTYRDMPDRELISEVACLHIKDGKVEDEYSKLIKNEGVNLRNHARFSNIPEEEIKTAVYLKDVENELKGFIGDKPLVGWGIQEDINLLNKNFENPEKFHYVDLQKLARKYLPEMEDGRMSTALDAMGLPEQEHRALGDCKSALSLYTCMQNRVPVQ